MNTFSDLLQKIIFTMGNVHGTLFDPPPGATLMVIESAEGCSNEACCGRKWDIGIAQPSFVSISSAEWEVFVQEMDRLVKQYKNEGLAALGMLGMLFGMVLFHPSFGVLARSGGLDISTSIMLMMATFFVGIFVTIFGQAQMRKHNQVIDQSIIQLCQRYTSPNATFAFQSMWTGTCKPKGARTYRAVCISPASSAGFGPHSMSLGSGGCGTSTYAAQGVPVAPATLVQPAPQQMQVSCPNNAKAGDAIQGESHVAPPRTHKTSRAALSPLANLHLRHVLFLRSDDARGSGAAGRRAGRYRARHALHDRDAIDAGGAGDGNARVSRVMA